MEEGPPIDWVIFRTAGVQGRLMDLLAMLPRERWAERDKYGYTLLHYACYGSNEAAVAALLMSGLVDVNARNEMENTPACFAILAHQRRILLMLCAAGAAFRKCNVIGDALIDVALCNLNSDMEEIAAVLMANGARLSTVRSDCRSFITPKLEAFERVVLRCRTAVVAMLRVKKAGGLWQWDKFLLRELAYAVWATRYDKKWQN